MRHVLSIPDNRIARVLFYADTFGGMVLLRGYSGRTPAHAKADLELARANKMPKSESALPNVEPSMDGEKTQRRGVMNHISIPGMAACLWLAAGPFLLRAQNEVACGLAVSQLQGYIRQVNSIAQFEYYQGIPARCGYNAYCGQALTQQLTAWYGQQSSLVNQWYTTLARQCSAQSGPRPRPRKRQTELTSELEDADDLEVDDEERTVRISIPSKPSGFSRRRP